MRDSVSLKTICKPNSSFFGGERGEGNSFLCWSEANIGDSDQHIESKNSIQFLKIKINFILTETELFGTRNIQGKHNKINV